MKTRPARRILNTKFVLLVSITFATFFAFLNIHVVFFKTPEWIPHLIEDHPIPAEFDPFTRCNLPSKPNEQHFFVLHVGPSKTGTTSIQNYLTKNDDKLKDCYRYIGQRYSMEHKAAQKFIGDGNAIASCINKQDALNCRGFQRMISFLQTHYELNNNVMFSAESFQDLNFDEESVMMPLKNATKQWHVRVVVTYRRYHELIISIFNQHHKPRKGKLFENWPDAGGVEIPTFESYFDTLLKHKRPRFKSGFMGVRHALMMDPVGFVKRGYEKYFEDVPIFNFHQEGDLITNFFCQMLPGADETCANHRNNQISSKMNFSTNPSLPLHYDMIAVAAYKKRILRRRSKRKQVRAAVERRNKDLGLSFSDFPLKCLSSEQEETLLNMSLDIERTILPNLFASPEGEARLREGFKTALEKKQFCSVDTDEVLKDTTWLRFFQSLR